MLNILVVQGLGALGYALLALSYFKKEKRQILFMQIFSYLFFLVHYYLLSGITGAICNLVGLLALVVIYFFEKYKIKNKIYVVIFFIMLLLAVNIMTYQNIYSIFPTVASIIAVASFLGNSENNIRGIGIIAAICWLVYAIVYKSYVSIVFEVITFIDVIIAFFKNLPHKKENLKDK